MVLAERADNLRNGRRSRGPSPNGQVTPESSSEDETASKRIGTSKTAKTGTYEAEKIRVGRDFQAVCPDLEPIEERKPELLADRALLVWSPTKDIADQKLEEYITVAKDKYGYNGEQALGMLFWHKHDLERAVLDLANFTPFPDEWTVEDKVLFDQAFQFHGKSFHRIRQMLPDKSISSLVKYYYSWKKTKSRSSLMDNKAKKLEHNAENGSEHSNEDSDTEDKKWPIHRGIRRASGSPPRGSAPEEMTHAPQGNLQLHSATGQTATAGGVTGSSNGSGTRIIGTGTRGILNNNSSKALSTTPGTCQSCGILCSNTHTTTTNNLGASNNVNGIQNQILQLCQSCHHYYRRTGTLRPTSGPVSKRLGFGGSLGMGSRVKRLPKGMHLNHDDLLQMAREHQRGLISGTGSATGDTILQAMDREITSLKIQVQNNKQSIGGIKRKTMEGPPIDDLRPPAETNRVNTKWTNDELLLAVQGVRKFGKDFQAISEAIGTKTEAHVRAFFVNYRRRYNLDSVLKSHETEKGQQMEVDTEGILAESSPITVSTATSNRTPPLSPPK